MKRGHRRTQSANLANSVHEEPLHFADPPPHDLKHNIVNLLQKCQGNAKQKVCNVESLNAAPKTQEDKMFNFGKGLLKVSLESKGKPQRKDNLGSIPEKLKANGRPKRNNDSDAFKYKPKSHMKSVLKISNKETKKVETQLAEGMSRLMKIKLGFQPKYRKLSMYEPVRSGSKQWKHKKEVSNVK